MTTSAIVRDPAMMGGKPIIKGTRVTVELILRKAAGGYPIAESLAAYPHLKAEDIGAAFQYAADLIAGEQILGAA